MRLSLSSVAAAVLAVGAAAQILPPPVDLTIKLAVPPSVDVSCIAIDPQGNIYVCGQTSQPIEGATRFGPGGQYDMFVTKLNPSGERIYAFTMGGSRDDSANGLKLDAQGNLYVLGFTQSEDYPYSAFLGTGTPYGAVFFKFDTQNHIAYNVVPGLPASGFELDSQGSIYFAGIAGDGQLPTHATAYRWDPGTAASAGFVAKLSPSGEIEAATFVDAPLQSAALVKRFPNGDVMFLSSTEIGVLDASLSARVSSQPVDAMNFAGTDGTGALYFRRGTPDDHIVISKYSADATQRLWQREYPYRNNLVLVDADGNMLLFGRGDANFQVHNASAPCWPNAPAPVSSSTTTTIVAITPEGEVPYATFLDADRRGSFLTGSDGRVYSFAETDSPAGVYWRGLVRFDAAYRPAEHISAGCVVHSATLNPTALSPGALMTLFGDGFAPPASAAPASMTVDGKAAPVLYTDNRQVNFIVPWSTRTDDGLVEVCVAANGDTSCLHAATAPGVPGFFRVGNTIAAINPDGTINSEQHPAPRGSYVSVYMTGTGALQKPVVDGAIAGPDLVRLASPVSAFMIDRFPPCFFGFCGASAYPEVLYAGSVPTVVYGVTVVIVRVPTVLAPGNRGLQLNVAGRSAQGFLWVGP